MTKQKNKKDDGILDKIGKPQKNNLIQKSRAMKNLSPMSLPKVEKHTERPKKLLALQAEMT